jgi:hypothetical protein
MEVSTKRYRPGAWSGRGVCRPLLRARSENVPRGANMKKSGLDIGRRFPAPIGTNSLGGGRDKLSSAESKS